MICKRTVRIIFASIFLALCFSGCEGVSHDNIENWANTEKGPGKLKAALRGEHAADLRAHAAEKLITIGEFAEVNEAFEAMSEKDRVAVMGALAPLLWDEARITDAMAVPSPTQVAAKDAMFLLRPHADEATRKQLDEYLSEWFMGGHYEGRAQTGKVTGARVMREVGPLASARLLEYTRALVAAPPDAQGRRKAVGDETLMALALTGNQEALKFLMELYAQPLGDASLPKRVMGALHFAYVEPTEMKPADGKALVVILDRLEAIALDRGTEGFVVNDTVEVLAALGPDCADSFARIVAADHPQDALRWMGVQRGIRCGGPAALAAIAGALPTDKTYERGILKKYLWDELAAFPRDEVAKAARPLFESKSWVMRVTAVEVLGALGKGAIKPEDIARIQSLTKDRTILRNWWGDPKKVPPGERKTDPTIGQVAAEVVKRLEDVAKGLDSK